MPVHRSDKYYFQRGDLVLQVEEVLFRVHRDILEAHSAFFEDMFSTPSSDDTEGTSDNNPLRLPEDLCGAQSFATLCKFLYPREMGEFPVILVKELDIWEPVLRATIALQMDSTRKYILARLGDDKPNIPSKAIPLLKLVVQYEEAPKNLKLECLRTLAYRRKPISRHEATALGREATYQVMLVRERVRSCFFSNQILANIDVSDSCDNPEACKDAIYQQIASNMSSESTSKSGGDKSDIFRMAKVDGLCHFCHPQRLMLASSLKINLLDQEIQRCMETLQPPAYEK